MAGAPVDPACQVVPKPDLRTAEGGHLLYRTSAGALVRLTPAGAETVARWLRGDPVGRSPAHQHLARRLEANGLATLIWPRPTSTPVCQAVIPVHNDPAGLRRSLRSLQATGVTKIVVVDDGSDEPVTAAEAARWSSIPVEILRRKSPGGPAVARQSGLGRLDSPLVLFVDAGVQIGDDTVETLRGALSDPGAVAAAPRVRSELRSGLVGRYDAHRSPLDLGPASSLVGPTQRVTYVPTACLLARVAAINSVGGFDPDLRFGEDVDLVWRLAATGSVHYCADATAWHRPRATVPAFVSQRVGYHSAAAALAQRHGHQTLAPAHLSWWTVAVLGCLLTGHPSPAVALVAAQAAALAQRLPPELPERRIRALLGTIEGNWHLGLSAVAASLRAWAPLVVGAGLVVGRARQPLRRLVIAAVARRLLDRAQPDSPTDTALDLTLGVVDDLASCAGLWLGAFRHRTMPPVRPRMIPLGARPSGPKPSRPGLPTKTSTER